jgi:hypothetical protein
MPGPPSTPVLPWPIFVRVKDTPSGAYVSGAKMFGVNETDGGCSRPTQSSQADGSIIIDAANMSNWKTTNNDTIHIEVTKDNRSSSLFEKISVATRASRFAAYPLIAELREDLPERIGIVGSAIVGRKMIGRDKQ